MSYVYLLRCNDGSLYCGWTPDLTARLAAHNGGRAGAKYTRSRGPVTLAYSEILPDKGSALRREAAIKKLSRAQKEALVQTQQQGEMLTIYDAAGHPCGDRPRAIVHAQGLRHRVCHLWVTGEYRGVSGLWLQQRAKNRPLYPGMYDLSSTGHIAAGETPLCAMLREAQEEIGLTLSPDALTDVGCFEQCYARTDGGIDDELAQVFLTTIDGLPPFSPGPEVRQMAFVSLADFARAHEEIEAPALRGKTPAGGTVHIAHDAMCCLHPKEWDGVWAVQNKK